MRFILINALDYRSTNIYSCGYKLTRYTTFVKISPAVLNKNIYERGASIRTLYEKHIGYAHWLANLKQS